MDRLNYFRPFQSKAPWHEDQLTRAFLVVLRLVPLAQAAFIDLVRENQESSGVERRIPSLSALETPTVTMQTQVGQISMVGGRLLSLLLTNEKWVATSEIHRSDRTARYDGLVAYEPEWILTIENKPWSQNVRPEQLEPALAPESSIEVDPVAVVLRWEDVIRRLSGLLERSVIHGAEAMIAEDFLDFVDEQFSYLKPYGSLPLCKENEYLLQKRCRGIMEDIHRERVEHHRGFKDFIRCVAGPVRMVYLCPRPEAGQWWINLEMYPGDTITQAVAFFRSVDRQSFLALRDKGWKVTANMHFAFMSTNLVWAAAELSVEEYLEYWSKHVSEIRQASRDVSDFAELFDRLKSGRIISEADMAGLKEKFSDTKRQTINVCPGFSVTWSWSLDQAVELDRGGRLAAVVRAKIDEAMTTWGQSMAAS
jgi:hypothetical protein